MQLGYSEVKLTEQQLLDSRTAIDSCPPSTDGGRAIQYASANKIHDSIARLKDPRLLRSWSYINGKWEQADDADEMVVYSPGDGLRLASVQKLGAVETKRGIDKAELAFLSWKEMLPQQRSELLRLWGQLMIANKEDLALIMTLEQGKPLSESLGEIEYAASFFDWFSGEARRINGEVIGGHLPHRQMIVQRQPVGVAAAITPWNFPSAMITRKAGAALAAGCTMVVRPASETPFSALAIAELADRAGIPPGVFSVLPGSRDIVTELCTNPKVKTVSFTGSTEIGRLLLGQAAHTVKKVTMELGGHAPFIIFPDSDIEAASQAAVEAKFQTTGQDCLAANRIYVHTDIYDEFIDCFTRRVSLLKVGNGLEPGVDIGPLMNRKSIAKCVDHVRDALAKGGRLLFGGEVHSAGDLFYTPTVLADVTDDMHICSEETFGPVAAIIRFESEEELVGRVNHPELGLISYLFTKDHDRICRLSKILEFGMVAVNCVKVTGGPIPFGGVKQSGLGREGGHWGVEEYLDTKYICSSYKTM